MTHARTRLNLLEGLGSEAKAKTLRLSISVFSVAGLLFLLYPFIHLYAQYFPILKLCHLLRCHNSTGDLKHLDPSLHLSPSSSSLPGDAQQQGLRRRANTFSHSPSPFLSTQVLNNADTISHPTGPYQSYQAQACTTLLCQHRQSTPEQVRSVRPCCVYYLGKQAKPI